MNANRPNEVGATGTTAKRDTLDGQVRLGRQHLGEQSSHLNLWRVAFDLNAVSAAGRTVAANGVFEGVGRSGPGEQLFELSQADSRMAGANSCRWGS
jgi:hypothetical protein